MSQDPGCKGTNEAENVVVNGGDLANVFVYVKDGLGNRTFDVPKDPVVLDQKGCQYHPHVLGVMAGQTVQIKNDDPTTHNIHPTPKDNREWNESQPPSSPAIEKNFAREEIMLPVKVQPAPVDEDVHQRGEEPVLRGHRTRMESMRSRACRRATTRSRSSRRNSGEQDQKVTVAAKDTKTVDQSFKPAAE